MKRLLLLSILLVFLMSCSLTKVPDASLAPLQTATESMMGFVPLNREVRTDLDGDGNTENLKYNGVDLSIDGTSFKEVIEPQLYTHPDLSEYLVIDLITSDRQVEIGIRDEGRSGHPTTRFYAFDGTTLKSLGAVETAVVSLDAFDGKGNIRGAKALDVLQNWSADAIWRYERGRIIELVPSAYAVNDSQQEVVLKQELPIYDNMGDAYSYRSITPQNVRLLETDNRGWVMVQGTTGEKGWFKVRGKEVVDLKRPAKEVFDGLK